MKKVILPSFLCLLALGLWSQTVTVSESVSTRDDSSYEIFSDGHGNVLLFRDKTTSFEVQGFDEKMRMKWEKEIELDKKRPEVVKLVPMGGDFCVIYRFYQKGKLILKAHRYNPGANLVDSVTIKDLGNRIYSPNFEVVFSDDKKAALIYFEEEQKEFTVFSFHMGRMKLLWEKTFRPDDMVLHRDFLQMLVDNDGNMALVLKKDNQRAKQKNHFLEFFYFGETVGESLRRFTVNMKGNLTYDAQFSFDNVNHTLVAGGMYSEDNLSRAEGYFYLNISPADPDRHSLQFNRFSDDFVNVLLEKEKEKNKGITEVSVQEIALRRDGGIILIGELNKEFQRGAVSGSYYARTGFRPIVDYYYDDLFLISIHPDGQEHWKTILHKKQYSQDDNAFYSSYFLAKTPAALRVIFNDEIKQENTVSEYVVRGNGEYDRNAVMNTERKELMLSFRNAVQIAANEVVVPSERRNRLKLVRVTY
jgi:hypothetical protein